MTKKRSQGFMSVGDLLQDKGTAVTIAPKETSCSLAAPEAGEFNNSQLNLFQEFLCNTSEERDRLSNAIDFWDSVPRFNVSRKDMSKSRLHERFLEKNVATFQYRGTTYTRTITPARVTDLDGQQRDYYPSATEELVEDALRKLATEQHRGYFDRPNYRSGVVFSMYELREELAKRGHARSYQEVRLALDILSGSLIEISSQDALKGEMLTRSPYLPSVVAVSRKRLKDDPQAKWAVQFHPLVTGSIDKVTYRQFNYDALMKHTSQLARWLHKQLVLKCTGADLLKPFSMRYSTVKRDSGLLDGYSRERDAIASLQSAFEELKGQKVLASFDRADETGLRKKLVDVVFQIWPSAEFVREVKAANKRLLVSAKGAGR
jgi:hypothetical protein